jgi:hypothetical protein
MTRRSAGAVEVHAKVSSIRATNLRPVLRLYGHMPDARRIRVQRRPLLGMAACWQPSDRIAVLACVGAAVRSGSAADDLGGVRRGVALAGDPVTQRVQHGQRLGV